MKEIFEEESRLHVTYLELKLLLEETSDGLDYFLLLFFGHR